MTVTGTPFTTEADSKNKRGVAAGQAAADFLSMFSENVTLNCPVKMSPIRCMGLLHYAFVLPEEVFLRRELGNAFDEYASRIPRWVLR